MEYYESIKLGVEIRRTLTTCDDAALPHVMQELAELLIESNQKHLVYKFIIHLSHTQTVGILHKMEEILPIHCSVDDSITQSMNVVTPKQTVIPVIQKDNNAITSNNNNHNTRSICRPKRHKKNKTTPCGILSVSSDVLLSIFNCLSVNALLSLQTTCRYFLRECLHPKALYEIRYSFDNEHCIPQHLPLNQLRFANIHKLCLSHEFGEFDGSITDKQFNPQWFNNVKELSCLFSTEYTNSSNFNRLLGSKSFTFKSVKKLSINLAAQFGSDWLNLILHNVIHSSALQQLHLTHILESASLMELILQCKCLQVLSINNLDFPTVKYFDSTEYEEFFEREEIVLPNIQKIIYIDEESGVGIHEWMRFIGCLIANTQQNKMDLCVSHRCLSELRSTMSVLFTDQLKTKAIIQKLHNVSIDVGDSMIHSVIGLTDKLLEFDHHLHDVNICGIITQRDLGLIDALYQRFKCLFHRSNRTFLSFSDYQHDTNGILSTWIHKLQRIAPNKASVNFESKRNDKFWQ
eukprot:1064836_1